MDMPRGYSLGHALADVSDRKQDDAAQVARALYITKTFGSELRGIIAQMGDTRKRTRVSDEGQLDGLKEMVAAPSAAAASSAAAPASSYGFARGRGVAGYRGRPMNMGRGGMYGGGRGAPQCYKCGGYGHIASHCTV
jgi:hypothetical protein